MTNMINLDYLAAQSAQELAARHNKKTFNVETAATKALGVLQENGVYGCFLYLLAKEDNVGKFFSIQLLKLLKLCLLTPLSGDADPVSAEEILDYINKHVSTASLNKLMLVKEILEKVLIYTRYGAKAKE